MYLFKSCIITLPVISTSPLASTCFCIFLACVVCTSLIRLIWSPVLLEPEIPTQCEAPFCLLISKVPKPTVLPWSSKISGRASTILSCPFLNASGSAGLITQIWKYGVFDVSPSCQLWILPEYCSPQHSTKILKPHLKLLLSYQLNLTV